MYKFFAIKSCLLIVLLTVWSCKKNDYIVGGSLHSTDQYVNSTIYDVLKSLPQYDTLIQLIDTAGLKDKINEEGITFFAPMDQSIYNYLNDRTVFLYNNVDIDAKFYLDSLFYYLKNNINGTKDSLLMYLINKPLTYDVMTAYGTQYTTELNGNNVIVSYEYTKSEDLGNNPILTNVPRVVYFTQLWHDYPVSITNPIDSLPSNTGVHTLVHTSGIRAKNGILHLLDASQDLFFYGTKR